MVTDDANRDSWDVVVVGGGSAGLAAALTLSRALRNTLVIDGGGQRNGSADHSHGVLGFEGIAPSHLLDVGRHEIATFGGHVRTDRVTSAMTQWSGFVLHTAAGNRVSARQLSVATGVTDELPAVPGVAEHWGRQVVICPYCDGWELRGRRIGILGTGMKSVSQAQLVRQWSDHIVLFVNDIVTLSETDRIGLHARGITVVEGGVTHIEQLPDRALIVHTPHQAHACDAVFTAPRPIPNDSLLRELGARTHQTGAGSFITVTASGKTSIDGLWAIGNVVDPSLKVATALGNGMATGTHVNEALVHADIAKATAATPSCARPRPC